MWMNALSFDGINGWLVGGTIVVDEICIGIVDICDSVYTRGSVKFWNLLIQLVLLFVVSFDIVEHFGSVECHLKLWKLVIPMKDSLRLPLLAFSV
jgi:hypothetical protein